MTTINYVNGLCGSGKTYAIVRKASNIANRGGKVLLVQPTVDLINETVRNEFAQTNIKPLVITSETNPDGVISAIVGHMKSTKPETGEVLIITHAAFFKVPYWHNAQDWVVMIDEIPPIENGFDISLPDTHEIMTNDIEIADKSHPEYWRIEAKAGTNHLQTIAANPRRDDVYKYLQPLAARIVNPAWHVYVAAKHYDALTTSALTATTEYSKKLIAHAVMQPSVFDGFQAVYIAGACFTESMMYILWSTTNEKNPNGFVTFVDKTDTFGLRYTDHGNGHLMTIKFAVPGRWSKYRRDKTAKTIDGSQKTIGKAFVDGVESDLNGAKAIFWANKDIEATINLENAETIPHVPHGLNEYAHIDNCVLVSALNPFPSHFSFLESYYEVSGDIVQTALHRQSAYQAAYRTSLRDPKSTSHKTLYVPDQDTADWFAAMHKGCKISQLKLFDPSENLDSRPGRHRVHEVGTDRKAVLRYKQKQINNRMIRLNIINQPFAHSTNNETMLIAAQMNEVENRKYTNVMPTDFQGTIFDGFYAKRGDALHCDFDYLFETLVEAQSASYANTDKHAASLISPAFYTPIPNVKEERGEANVVFAKNIILDNDGGTLTPDHFAAIFPSWEMIVHSSWTNTENKWRAIIRTDLAMCCETYRDVCKYIVETLERNRIYHTDDIAKDQRIAKSHLYSHKLDKTKLNPASIYYLPTLGADPQRAFLRHLKGENRSAMDVAAVMQLAPVAPEQTLLAPSPVHVAPAHSTLSDTASPALKTLAQTLRDQQHASYAAAKAQKVQEALASASFAPGQRDAEIWRLMMRLHNAGCTEQEAIDHANDALMILKAETRRELKQKAVRSAKKLWK